MQCHPTVWRCQTLLSAAHRTSAKQCCQTCHSCLGIREKCKAEPSLNSWMFIKMCINFAPLCGERALWLLASAALPSICWSMQWEGTNFENSSNSTITTETSGVSVRKLKFATVFPRGTGVSVTQPANYNGNTIMPQMSLYPQRALISLALEHLTPANDLN